MLPLWYLLLVTALCAALHARRVRPATLYLSLPAALALFGVLAWLGLSDLPQPFAAREFSYPDTDPAYHDTYYVVATYRSLLLLGLVLLLLPAILGAQQRLGAMEFPALTRWLFWPLFLAFVAAPSLYVHLLRRATPASYDDLLPQFETAARLSTAAALAGWLALLTLTLLALWSVTKRLRTR